MKEIKHFEDINEPEIIKEEKALKNIYNSNKRALTFEKEKEAQQKKKEELRLRMERVYKKQGKTAMPRSMKKKVKKEVIQVVENQDVIDRRKYLGELLPIEE